MTPEELNLKLRLIERREKAYTSTEIMANLYEIAHSADWENSYPQRLYALIDDRQRTRLKKHAILCLERLEPDVEWFSMIYIVAAVAGSKVTECEPLRVPRSFVEAIASWKTNEDGAAI